MKKYLTLIAISNIFLLVNVVIASASTFSLTDPSDDVDFYENSNLVNSGNYHDEIDIVNFEIVMSLMITYFESTPINDANHMYIVLILWNEGSELNKTYCQFGAGLNIAQTTLYTTTGTPIAEYTTLSPVDISLNNFTVVIPAYAEISNIYNPYYVDIHSYYIVVPDEEFYTDNLIEGTSPTEVNDLSSLFVSTSIITIFSAIFITSKLKKKKK